MNFIELIGLAGFGLGLGAALDYMVKPNFKKLIAQWVQGLGSSTTTINYGVSTYLDAFFGPRLASVRAIILSIIISLGSLSFAYLFAYLTTEQSIVAIFSNDPSWRTVWIFLLFLIGCVIGDYFSFAQTRIFLRTVDSSRKGVVAIGLALSDAVISLAIFVGFFSITRLIGYLLIVGSSAQGPITQVQHLNTEAIAYAVDSAVKDGLIMPSEVEWSTYIGKVVSIKDASRFDEVARRYANDLVNSNQGKDIVDVRVNLICEKNSPELMLRLRDASTLIAKEVAGRRGIEVGGPAFLNLNDDIMKRLITWRPKSSECPAPILMIKQSLTPAGLLSVAGFSNAIAASFERTLFDFYTNFGFKLAPYAFVNPEDDIGNFYSSLIGQTQYGFLGLTYSDPNIQYALSEFTYEPKTKIEKLQIPFSPMLASSLTVSLFFWFYIFLIYSSRIILSITSNFYKFVSFVKLETSPFTFVFFGLGVIVIAIYIVASSFGAIWSFAFGSFG